MAEDVFGIVGTVIAGAYRVDAVVAEGGFAVVYRAHHAGFRAPVALKCLKIPQQLGLSHQEEFLEQFRAEAELLFRLSASIPEVVRPLHVDAVRTPSRVFVPFMALEWLEGETLDGVVQRRLLRGERPMSLKRLVKLLTPVARALERAHNFVGPNGPVSIVHRDLKPENIFVANVAGEQVVKILDFGIAKAKSVASQVAGRASQAGSPVASFTPAYGAPEQWLPRRFGQTGPWTDVWGLALSMVEVLAAHPVLDGDHAAMMGTAIDPLRRPTPRNEGVEVSDAVEQVFARALAVDPRQRYQHAGSFWDALIEALELPEEARRDTRMDGRNAPRVEQLEAALPQFGTLRGARRSTGGLFEETSSPEIPDLELGAPQRGARELGGVPAPGVRARPVEPSPLELTELAAAPLRSAPLEVDLGASSAPELAMLPSEVDRLPLELDLSPHDRRPGVLSSPPGPPPIIPTSPAAVANPPWSPEVTAPALRPEPAVHAQPPPPRVPREQYRPAGRRVSSFPAGRDEVPLTRRLLPGIAALLGSIVLTLADQAYAAYVGELFAIGPVRLVWIAAALMILGIVLVVHALLPHASQ